jgi:hypothetical protein
LKTDIANVCRKLVRDELSIVCRPYLRGEDRADERERDEQQEWHRNKNGELAPDAKFHIASNASESFFDGALG